DVPRIVYWDLRARAAVAAAAQATGAERATLARQAARAVKRLGRERAGWARAHHHLHAAALAHLGGDDTTAVTLLGHAAEGFDAADMKMHAAFARGRRGVLVGGEDGRADRRAQRAWTAEQNVANPE